MMQKPLFWFMYIIASVLLGYEFLTDHLYGSSLLQFMYVVISIYGWYKWTHKDTQHHVLVICHTSLKQWINYIMVTIVLGVISFFVLKHSGDSDYFSDSVLSAVCLTATYMAALKQIESWFIFASTVLISIPLYLHYHLYFTSLTYLIFCLLDLSGGIKWLVDYRRCQKSLVTA